MEGLVTCGKRRAAADANNPLFSKLGDDLLEEILIRLPDPRSAVQCKIICKNWCSRISNPYFFRHWIRFRQKPAEEDPIQPCPESVRVSILSFLPLPDMIIDCSDKLNALSRFEVYNCAEGDNLFLCGFREYVWPDELSRTFFVCNLRTKQWIDLPMSPPTPHNDGFPNNGGYPIFLPTLVCLPCNDSINLDLGDGETPVYTEYRFRVLRMHHVCTNDKPRLDVYCSESPGVWTSHVLGDEFKRLLPYQNPLEIRVLRGGLFWMHPSGEAVIMFHPFRLDRNPSVFKAAATSNDGIWISHGQLYMVRLHSLTSFSVWKFQLGGGSFAWKKQCEVTMDTLRWCGDNKRAYQDSFRMDLCSQRPCVGRLFGKLCDECDSGKMVPETELKLDSVIGLHPEDPQIVYLKFVRHRKKYHCSDKELAVVCNLHTMTLEVFSAVYQIHSGAWWTSQFKKSRRSCWPAQIRNFGKLGGMYNGHYLSVNSPATAIKPLPSPSTVLCLGSDNYQPVDVLHSYPVPLKIKAVVVDVKRLGFENQDFFNYTRLLSQNLDIAMETYFKREDGRMRKQWLKYQSGARIALAHEFKWSLPRGFFVPSAYIDSITRVLIELGLDNVFGMVSEQPLAAQLLLQIEPADRKLWLYNMTQFDPHYDFLFLAYKR